MGKVLNDILIFGIVFVMAGIPLILIGGAFYMFIHDIIAECRGEEPKYKVDHQQSTLARALKAKDKGDYNRAAMEFQDYFRHKK